jgi:hypothetical protein
MIYYISFPDIVLRDIFHTSTEYHMYHSYTLFQYSMPSLCIAHYLTGVSVRSHSWIACRRRAQCPSILCHDLFIKGDQMEIMALGGITLTQGLSLVRKEQRRFGILTSASGLIKR